MKLCALLVLFSTFLVALTIADDNNYFFIGSSSWSNTNITNGDLFYQAEKYEPPSGECTENDTGTAFGTSGAGKVVFYSDNALKDVSLFGVGLRVTGMVMAATFVPEKRHPFQNTRFTGIGAGRSYYINNTVLNISEDSERISSSNFFTGDLEPLNEELDKQVLELLDPKIKEGNYDDPWKILCGSNYPNCLRKDVFVYVKPGVTFSAKTNTATGYADYSLDVFNVQVNYQGEVTLNYGTTCGSGGLQKFQSGHVGPAFVTHYACETYDEHDNRCSQWVKI